MPKKPTTTKEAMVEGAFQLIREEGHEHLTARNLAARLGCSTQPIMYQFPDLETLRDLTYQKADAFHSEYILAGEDLLEIGIRYVRFAEEEPQLFRFLFQSGRFSGFSLDDLIRAPETAGVLSTVSVESGWTAEDAVSFFEPLVAVVHGYASLIANNGMKYDYNAIREALIMIFEGIDRGGDGHDETLSKK
ncbi:MAG: TetR/AcrR family transcriptional regulator [Parasporobacterium sp.]|nr:TetR/AcrR family transcriptional regulator [Parasporobacterium sp.]